MSTEILKATGSASLEERVRQIGKYASWQLRTLDDTAEGDHERGKWQYVIEILSGASTFPRAGYQLGNDDLIHGD